MPASSEAAQYVLIAFVFLFVRHKLRKRAAGPVLTVSWTSDCYAEGREVGAEMAYGDDVHSTVLLMKFHVEMGVSVRLLGFPESAGDTWRRT